MNFPDIKVPKNLHCPACGKLFAKAIQTRPGSEPDFRKGMIVICGECSVVLQLGDSALIAMKPEAVNALPTDVKKSLMMSKLAVIRSLEKKVPAK